MAKRLALAAAAAAAAVAAPARPNIVFFLTDDQDVLLDSMRYMNVTNELIVNRGATFNWSFAAVPVCCPSRASLHTGLYQHNTLVWNNSIPGNCAGVPWQQGPEQRTSATYLQAAGYHTYFGGKYLNNYGFGAEPVTHVPPGWTDWQGLVGNSAYYNYSLSNNGVQENHGHDYASDYLTDLVRNRSLAFIDKYAPTGEPMFIVLSTPASHQPADPAPQYSTLFEGIQAPRQPNFNVHIPDTHWFEDVQGVTGPLDANAIAFVDLLYRRRLQTLQSVDEAVAQVTAKLASYGLLNSTYFVYTADNGYHLGQGGLGLDKRQPWHYDSRVPLYISGPGIAPGSVLSSFPVSNVDLAPTFLDLAGLPVPQEMDGVSLKSVLMATTASADGSASGEDGAVAEVAAPTRQSVLVSYHGENGPMPAGCGIPSTQLNCYMQTNVTTPPYFYGHDWCSCQDATNNTYACIFTVNATVNSRYCEFFGQAGGFVEYFLPALDPYEMTNQARSLAPGVAAQLHDELQELRACVGSAQCSKW